MKELFLISGGDINSSEDSIEMYFQRLDDPYAQVNKVNLKEVIFKNTPNINKDFKICCFSIIRERFSEDG
ncbi:hypothetical protein [Staphylococcus epidermidis]|uniref:hypothetical protein n=1 Tax=Staphylococcus epidermidis TaxID=1282 RepID=UPI001D0CFE94|nr:hypothetical protein [Staphylococcus epidermidis]